MCSIAGVFGAEQISADPVVRMNRAQRHRGPDDEGVAELGKVVLGNTRLAIIDTSAAGHQPMHDPETGNWITYNGETYNFKELRNEIGGEWISNTDTEVVLRGYGKWGVDVFQKLRGMFAMALWDNQKQQLLLARDPLGIKPLYFSYTTDQFVFASELRALLASGLVPRRIDHAAVASYLACGSVTAPLTIVEGIKQLLPGHYLQVSANDRRDVEFAVPRREAVAVNRKDAVARLRAELEESVRLHLVSDVPLGIFLSGGMDSSALVALTSRYQTPQTFSVVFDEPAFNEAPFSRAVAERFRTEHHEIRLTENQLIEMLPEAIAALDQPTMDGINTFVVSKAVKNAGITVALSGLGGDELFAGYPSFRRAVRLASAMSQVSKRILSAASGIGRIVVNGSIKRQKFWQLANSEGTAEDVYRISRQLFSPEDVERITRYVYEEGKGHHQDTDIVNAISQLELSGYMTNTLLRDTDAMSMAHSLEVRVPFVDMKVVDYVLSVPGVWKLREGSAKPLLADAIGDLLPRDFMARPKMGFTLPFEKWLQQNLRHEVSSVLEEVGPAFYTGAVRRIWHTFLRRPDAIGWSRPWSLYVLAKWCEINGVTSA
ncbi:MAG TPA: asparagine synthase (glutamine-hydrolyzing) [Pyrinomonadaceae bacterium]